MYYLFKLFGKMPAEYLELSYFERIVVRSFLRLHIKEETEVR
nr:MAG TPA: hypothetical protein [Caudoviricetes sp.]